MNKLRKFLQRCPWVNYISILIGTVLLYGIVIYYLRKNTAGLSEEEFKEFMREVQLLSLFWR